MKVIRLRTGIDAIDSLDVRPLPPKQLTGVDYYRVNNSIYLIKRQTGSPTIYTNVLTPNMVYPRNHIYVLKFVEAIRDLKIVHIKYVKKFLDARRKENRATDKKRAMKEARETASEYGYKLVKMKGK